METWEDEGVRLDSSEMYYRKENENKAPLTLEGIMDILEGEVDISDDIYGVYAETEYEKTDYESFSNCSISSQSSEVAFQCTVNEICNDIVKRFRFANEDVPSYGYPSASYEYNQDMEYEMEMEEPPVAINEVPRRSRSVTRRHKPKGRRKKCQSFHVKERSRSHSSERVRNRRRRGSARLPQTREPRRRAVRKMSFGSKPNKTEEERENSKDEFTYTKKCSISNSSGSSSSSNSGGSVSSGGSSKSSSSSESKKKKRKKKRNLPGTLNEKKKRKRKKKKSKKDKDKKRKKKKKSKKDKDKKKKKKERKMKERKKSFSGNDFTNDVDHIENQVNERMARLKNAQLRYEKKLKEIEKKKKRMEKFNAFKRRTNLNYERWKLKMRLRNEKFGNNFLRFARKLGWGQQPRKKRSSYI